MVLRLGSKCNCDGSNRALKFIHGFQRLVLYSTSPSSPTNLPTEEVDPCFPNYLVSSLGFSKQQSLSITSNLSQLRRSSGTKNLEFNFAAKADSAIDFLHKQGFGRPQIRKVVSCYPRILLSQVDKTLKPKFEVLHDLGLSDSDLVRVVMNNPTLLKRNFGSVITAFRQVLGRDDHVVSAILSCSQPLMFGSYAKDIAANVALLENSYGISIDNIRKHLIRHPKLFLTKADFFSDALSSIEKKLGIPRHSPMFLYGVFLVISYSEETLESKFRTFEDFGWTRSDIMALLQHNPTVFTSSVARFKKSLDVLMNELGYEPAYLAKHNSFFTYSMEKRIIPRHRVLLVLKDKGLIRKNFPLDQAIVVKECMFLEKFVLPFQEVHEVYSNLTGNSVKLVA